jgi:hypothetical protein
VVGLIPLVTAAPALAARQKTIRISDASVVEGDAGQKTMSFTVSWTGSKGGAAPSVSYATANRGVGAGYATAGADYTATSGTLTFNPGTTTQTINVDVLSDVLNEANETFTVNLTNPTDATISGRWGRYAAWNVSRVG